MKLLSFVRAAALTTLSALLSGCVLSLHPLYTEETIEFRETLLGTWSGDDTTWKFERKGDKQYALTYLDDDGKAGRFEATLVKLGDQLFLDLFPDNPEGDEPAYWKFHLLKAHTFLVVDELGPRLKMRAMNPDWMVDYLEKSPEAIAATIVEKRPVLTASPDELQKLVSGLAGQEAGPDQDEAPFGKPIDLRKLQ